MIRQVGNSNIIRIMIYSLIFMVASGYFTYYAIAGLCIITFFVCLIRKEIIVNVRLGMLLCFCLIHWYKSNSSFNWGGVIHQLALVLLFFCALQLSSGINGYITIIESINVIGLGFLFHLGVTVIQNFKTGRIFNSAYLINPVTGEYLAPTHYSVMLYIGLCLVAYYTFKENNRKVIRFFLSFIVIVLTLICIFMLARRMLLVAIAIIFLCVIFYRVKAKEFKIKHNSLLLILSVCLLAMVVLLIYGDEILVKLEGTLLFTRFDGKIELDSGRGELLRYHLEHFFEHINGGGFKRKEYGYAHNLWLDVYDEAGWIAFVLLVIVSVMVLSNYLNGCKKCSINENEKFLLLLVLVISVMHFITEPAYYSVVEYMWCISFILGVMDGRIGNNTKLVVNKKI